MTVNWGLPAVRSHRPGPARRGQPPREIYRREADVGSSSMTETTFGQAGSISHCSSRVDP